MARLARKRKLSSYIPVAPAALLVSLDSEGKNAVFLDCEMIVVTPLTTGVNNCTPMHISPIVQLANKCSLPREFDNRGEGRFSAELAMKMLVALEGINTKLDSCLPPPDSYSGSTETASFASTSTVLYCYEWSWGTRQKSAISKAKKGAAVLCRRKLYENMKYVLNSEENFGPTRLSVLLIKYVKLKAIRKR
ncbi:hypothetical protein H4S08_004087 [Coemansia sp. RSA 1365]|nr:hypothetical protein H4S08_004087 [Coemansia sp. RSA 1365]